MKYIITERQYRLLSEEEDKVETAVELLRKSTDLIYDFGALSNDWDLVVRLAKGRPFILKGDLDLRYHDIKTLGSLVGVEGFLNLRNNKTIESLGNLQYVGGDLDLFNTNIESLGDLQSVGGDLILFNCGKLKNLGNLKYVGGDLYLRGTNIESLEKIESVGEDLLLNGTKIESLGNLQYVGGNLVLRNTKIESLGNLQYVGGNLVFKDTPLSKTTTEEEIRSQVEVGGNVKF